MQTKPPPALQSYIGATTLAAAAVVGALLARTAAPDAAEWLIAIQAAALVALARCYPVHLAAKSKFTLDTAPTIAALVLLPAAPAVLSVAAGMLAGELWLRARSFQVAFNVSVTVLRTAAGATVLYTMAGGAPESASLLRLVPALVPTTMTILGVSIVLVDVAAAMTMGRRLTPAQVWARHRSGLGHELALALLGLVTAYAAVSVPWVLVLMVFPGALLYHSLRDGVALRQRTLATLTQLADLSEGSTGGGAHGERVAGLCARLAEALGVTNPSALDAIAQAGRLHQLTALGGPAGSGPTGATLAAQLLSGEAAAAFIRHQYDRWDGDTPAQATRGAQIPLGARILAVADAFDHLTAFTSTPLSSAAALARLQSERATRYDPAVLDALDGLLRTADAPRPAIAAPFAAAAG